MSERTIDVTGLPGAKKPSCAAALVGESARVAYEESRRRAEEAGRPLYDEILSNHRRYLEQEKQKLAQAISSRRRGYKLRWPDGKELAHATFVPSQAPRRARLRPAGFGGLWSLWRIALDGGGSRARRILRVILSVQNGT